LIGRGLNMGNMLEAPNEGDWGATVQDYYFTMIKNKGFDSVRIPIKWSGHSQSSAPYTIDATFLARVDQIIDWAVGAGLTVVINIHHFDEMAVDAQGSRARFLGIWTQLAEHYSSLPDTVMFELLNEANGDLNDQAFLDSMYADAIGIIRATNPTRTLIAGGLWWNSSGTLGDMAVPAGENNLIGTFHMYIPFEFTHSGATWVDPVPAPNATWSGSATETAQVDREFTQAARFTTRTGLPVLMGEFGAFSGADQASRVRWTTYVVDTAERFGVVWTYWEFNSGFGVSDPNTDTWHDDLVGALIH
jgi:endoglucanase